MPPFGGLSVRRFVSGKKCQNCKKKKDFSLDYKTKFLELDDQVPIINSKLLVWEFLCLVFRKMIKTSYNDVFQFASDNALE